jgi:zinc transport system permease protein
MDWSFVCLPFIACVAICVLTCTSGPMLIWRRMSFLCDSLSHGAILGFTVAHILHLPILVGITGIGLVFIFYWYHQKKTNNPQELGLAIFSYATLFFGLSLIYFFPGRSIDPIGYFVGDIFFIQSSDIWIIAIFALISSFFWYFYWNRLILLAFDHDLSFVHYPKTNQLDMVLLTLTIGVIALGIKIFGGFLFPAFLLLPPAIGGIFSFTPLKMIIFSFIIGILSSGLGLLFSIKADIPSSLGICLILILMYFIAWFIKKLYCHISQHKAHSYS